ncbi:MAG: DNA translocase FtsK 4TM domain-containing protein [Patescibacteria group bacterium]
MVKNNKRNKKRGIKVPSLHLSEDTQKSIWGVVLIFIAIFFTLSLLNLAGKMGEGTAKVLELFFGRGAWIIVSLFFLGGVVFLTSDRPSPYLSTTIGGVLFLIAIFSILELSRDNLGGYFGKILISLPKTLIGIWGSWVFFIFLFLISFALFFNTPIIRIRKRKAPDEKKYDEKMKMREGEGVEFKVKEISPVREVKEKIKMPFPKIVRKIDKTIQYKSLPLALLDSEENHAVAGNLRINAQIIKKMLKTFGIEVEMGEINIGPTVTQYTLKPAEGVKLSKILSLQKDLSLALAANPIRIEAPIPGRSLVGVEVPNQKRAEVKLKSLLSSKDFLSSAPLSFPLGKDVKGNPCFANLGSMPHLLVAGATGTGKTVFLNTLILSLLWRNSPQDLRIILVDPKRVEFTLYSLIPHLLCPPVTKHGKIIPVLKWLVEEMEGRFEILHQAGVKDIEFYNQELKENSKKEQKEENSEGGEESKHLPYIVFVVDELAAIMMASKSKEFEAGIVRLAQMSRAVGIHLVLATQRPSVEVLTGLIKANITSRIAFQVASQIDSRTILDMAGADHLLGRGDMLFLSAESARPRRFQSALVLPREAKKVIEYIQKTEKKTETEVDEEESLQSSLEESSETEGTEHLDFSEGDEELCEEAKNVVIRARKASASLLQRRLKIGYARAARILDILEQKGVIGPARGSKPRDVYISNEENGNNDQGLNNI